MSEIAVIIGSDSDIFVYEQISSVLKVFDVIYEKRIISAHRTLEILSDYVKTAEADGVKVFIAVAGMAAALPGVVASLTLRPVIGVPVACDSPVMGFDSIFSILQMPPGIVVATVGVNGGKNAALLAIEILALNNSSLNKKLVEYREMQKKKLIQKDSEFQKKD